MSGKTDKDVPGSDAEGPGQGGGTPAARYAADPSNRTAQSPVQERLRRQQELAQKILESAREEGQEVPEFQSASPAGRLHRRLIDAAEVQQEADGKAAGSAADFKTTRKEALEAEREEQRLAHQAEMDSLFDKRYHGDPDLQPTMDPVQEATSLLVVGELQPDVAYAHDKSGTVSQLADCIRDRNQDAVKSLFKAAKRGGDRWSEALDRIRTSLRADDRLEPALQSAVIFHWLSNNRGTAQTAQDCMRATIMAGSNAADDLISMVEEWGNPPEALLGAEPLRSRTGMAWFDPNRSAKYSIAWSKALFVLDRTLAHTLLNDASLVGTRSKWEVVKDEHGKVVKHTLIMQEGESVKKHQARIRGAYQNMEKVFRRKNAVDQMPSESQRVMSYMNSLDSGMLRQVNDALSRDKIKQEDVTWTIATTYAVDVEVEHNMGYEWGSSRKQRPARSDDDDATQDVPAPRRKRNNRKNKRSSAVVGAVGAASGASDKDRGKWTATEKSVCYPAVRKGEDEALE